MKNNSVTHEGNAPSVILSKRSMERGYQLVLAPEPVTLLQTQSTISESLQILRSVIDMLPTAAYTCDINGYVDYFNATAVQAWGRTPNIGDPEDRYCGCFKLMTASGEPIPKNECWMAQAMLQNTTINGGEVTIIQPTGQTRTVLAHASPFHDKEGKVIGAINVLADITERKIVERQRQRFVELVEQSSDLVAIIEIDNRVSYLNEAGQQLLALFPDFEKSSLRLEQLVAPELLTKFQQEIIPTIAKNGKWSDEIDFPILKTGKTITTNLSVSSLCGVEDEHSISYVMMAQDVTASKAFMEQSQHAKKLEAVGQLAGGIAHDFNNILMVIGGYAGRALQAIPHNHAARHSLEKLYASAEEASTLTRQLLTFSRREVIKREVFDINILLNEIGAMSKHLMGASIAISLHIPNEPTFVEANRSQLDQVVMNIMINARDAMPHGGALSVRSAIVPLPLTSNGEDNSASSSVLLEFTDTGQGIPLDVIEHVFEPFFTTKESHKGTGLGLATAYNVIQKCQGHIDLTSEEGKGTCVSIILPVAQEGSLESKTVPFADLPTNKYPQTILFVEDNEGPREIIALMLMELGFNKTYVMSSGVEALEFIQNEKHMIDVLITDVNMPGMDGIELAKAAKNFIPDLKVIYISGNAQGQLHEQNLEPRQEYFLGKPFSSDQLSRYLEKIFSI